MILDTLYIVSVSDYEIDLALMTLLFTTFTQECSRGHFEVEDDFGENLLCKVVGILDRQLDRRVN